MGTPPSRFLHGRASRAAAAAAETRDAAHRRRFDNTALELSLAAGRRIPRYRLWLLLQEQGLDPTHFDDAALEIFCDRHLEEFLAAQGCRPGPRALRRLRRRLLRFDPRHPTPCEVMERILRAHA